MPSGAPARIPAVSEAILWGAVAASSLVIGALLGLVRAWPHRYVGLVLAFGAGALISAVSFDLAEEGGQVGDPALVAVGLGAGAVTYFALNRVVGRHSRHGPGPRAGEDTGTALALGAFLDGIPEQTVLGIGIAAGEGVSVGLLVAIFVSNLPEAIGSATEMRAAGRRPAPIRRLWLLVALICAAATLVGYAIADNVSGNVNAAVDGFAAGALLVMLIDSMIPDAVRKGGDVSGLMTVLGFAVAAGLSTVS
jgi:zinc transporter, ZIP family